MTVTLELPPDLEVELSVRAAERGQAVPDYLLTLAEADVYGEIEMSEADRQEVIVIIQQELEGLHAGDKGILLEDYRAEVMAEYHRQKQYASQLQASPVSV